MTLFLEKLKKQTNLWHNANYTIWKIKTELPRILEVETQVNDLHLKKSTK